MARISSATSQVIWPAVALLGALFAGGGCYKASVNHRGPMKQESTITPGTLAAGPNVDADADADEKPAAKNKGNDGKKATSRVWKRTEQGTVLSRVSVGGGKFLELKRMRVSVQVQGGRVRTVLDHIYYNPFHRALQGTFRYTLPAGASISYYGMFVGRRQRQPRFFDAAGGRVRAPVQLAALDPQQVAAQAPRSDWGQLREARLVPAKKAREVYEEITRRQIDPALVEQVAPGTFQGRVFPVPARGYNRVIVAYEENLASFQGLQVYRFRFPREAADEIELALQHNPALGRLARHNLARLGCRGPFAASFLRCVWRRTKVPGDATLYFRPARADASWTAGVDPTQRQAYLVAQLRARLPRLGRASSRSHALFLLDTSLSSTPDRFAAQVALMKRLLAKSKGLRFFNVLLFDVGQIWADPRGWIANTPAARAALFARIDRILLEGATDLGAALDAAAQPRWLGRRGPAPAVDLFLLTDGQVSWGERSADVILHRFRRRSRWRGVRLFAYQFGLGSENTALLRRLTRAGGALFSCLGRGELDRCAAAHMRPAMLLRRVEIDGIGAEEVLVAGRQAYVFPGATVTVAARYAKDGTARVRLIGELAGRPIQLDYRLPVRRDGDLAPRAWGELAVRQLAELEDPRLAELIVAYAQHFRIPTPQVSMLVLETDAEYKQYGLDKQRQAQRVGDVARFIAARLQRKGAPRSPRLRWQSLLGTGLVEAGANQAAARKRIAALLAAVPAWTFVLRGVRPTKVWEKHMVPAAYVAARTKARREFTPFTQEARRRLRTGALGGALRSLSGIVEVHPSDARALRLVGYYLMAWHRPEAAGWALRRVVERRPYEPQAFRDLARAMIRLGRYGLAAALYEVVLAGSWHARFGAVKRIAQEEYALMLHQALVGKKLRPSVRALLAARQRQPGFAVRRAPVRVTLTWNTDNTDIDLWVIEPGGEKCFYSNRSTGSGGHLLEDITRGYGPERYENRELDRGEFKVKLKFFGHSASTFGNETHANVAIVLHAGTKRQRIIERTVILKGSGSEVHVTRFEL